MGVTVTAYPPYQPYQAYPGPGPAPIAPPPILVAVAEPTAQRRLYVALRLILVVPHLIVLCLLSVAAFVVAFIGWWGALFTGRLPLFAVNFLSGYLRWSTRVSAYLMLLTDVYPPFTPDDDPRYPVQVAIPEPQRLNRAAVFFRAILLVPVGILSSIVRYGTGVMGLAAWVITLVTGRLPAPFHQAYVAALRFQTRFYGYQLMLTPAYPVGLYGDRPEMVAWADAPAAGFGTPAAGVWGAGGGLRRVAGHPAEQVAAPADVRGQGAGHDHHRDWRAVPDRPERVQQRDGQQQSAVNHQRVHRHVARPPRLRSGLPAFARTAQEPDRGGEQHRRRGKLVLEPVRSLVLYPHVEKVDRPGERRAPEEDNRRLVQVGQRRARHAGQHREARVPRRQRRHRAHDCQPGQPVGHRHPHEAQPRTPLPPVRSGVEGEVGEHPEGEGGRRPTARHGADHGTRKHVIGHQHAP